MNKAARPYNVVIWGATGFTGRLAALHIARKADPNLRVALAGRDRSKLEKIREEMISKTPSQGNQNVDIIVADSKDQGTIDEMVKQTQVVMALAGPFMYYSKSVVDACVRLETDYCDITGEADYIQDLISQYHEEAKQKGVRVVNCCGFDSIPYDIGSFVTAEYLKKSMGVPCSRVEALNGDARGGPSGGTLATVQRMMDEPRDGMQDPCILAPKLQAQGKEKERTPQMGVTYSKECKSWSMMSVMATINSKVVYRTADLLAANGVYAPSFTYNEAQLGPGMLLCSAITGAIGLFAALLYFKMSRFFLKLWVIPKPGQGPSEDIQANGYFNVHFVGKGKTEQGEEKKAVGKFAYLKGDPGYAATSLMILEAALALVETQKQVKAGEGGILTPASALGWNLVHRLRESDFQIGAAEMSASDNAVTAKTDLTWVA